LYKNNNSSSNFKHRKNKYKSWSPDCVEAQSAKQCYCWQLVNAQLVNAWRRGKRLTTKGLETVIRISRSARIPSTAFFLIMSTFLSTYIHIAEQSERDVTLLRHWMIRRCKYEMRNILCMLILWPSILCALWLYVTRINHCLFLPSSSQSQQGMYH
jgi:hypothetical protein